MQIISTVGNPVATASGGQSVSRAGAQGDLIVSELHGATYEQAYRGNVFAVANQAAVSTSTTLNTTFTGLAIANPAGSGVNLVILKFMVAQFAVATAAVVSIAGGLGVAAGTLVPKNALVGSVSSSKATASAGATITAPVLLRPVASTGSLATTGYGLAPSIVYNCGGDLIVPPGSFVCSDTSIATTSALIFGFVWEEVPI